MNRVREVLGGVIAELEQVFGELEGLSREFAGLVDAEPPTRETLAALRPTIFGILSEHRGMVAGAGVITAPDLLRDVPRWLEWWWTTASGAPEALRVNLDPAAPDFFDYTTADWYATPERTLARQVTGPFVDYACTNEYTITLSVPVHMGDRLVGIAAADVLAASVERRASAALTAISQPVVLASADGRVIASNSPHWTPGLRIPAPGPAETSVVSWTIVDLETNGPSTTSTRHAAERLRGSGSGGRASRRGGG